MGNKKQRNKKEIKYPQSVWIDEVAQFTDNESPFDNGLFVRGKFPEDKVVRISTELHPSSDWYKKEASS